jgi:hypothetical protein
MGVLTKIDEQKLKKLGIYSFNSTLFEIPDLIPVQFFFLSIIKG